MKKMNTIEEALEREGANARAVDLSEEAVKTTRQRAAELLETRSAVVKTPYWNQAGWRLAVAASLCLAAVFVVFSRRPSGPAVMPTAGAAAAALAVEEIDSEINRIHNALDYKMSRFEKRTVAPVTAPTFETRSQAIRSRIQMCTSWINAELPRDNGFNEQKRITL